MEASLLLGTLRRIRFGLGGLFGRPHRARPVRIRPAEQPAPQAAARSIIAAFEQPRTKERPPRQDVLKLALVTSAAPVAPMAPMAPIASTTPVADKVVSAVRPVEAMPPPATIPAACVDQAPVGTMRSLEEVRADLARLRASAKERHAQRQAQLQDEAQAHHDIDYAPTDFMDFAPPKAEPAPRDNAGSSFAPTAFFDLASLKASA